MILFPIDVTDLKQGVKLPYMCTCTFDCSQNARQKSRRNFAGGLQSKLLHSHYIVESNWILKPTIAWTTIVVKWKKHYKSRVKVMDFDSGWRYVQLSLLVLHTWLKLNWVNTTTDSIPYISELWIPLAYGTVSQCMAHCAGTYLFQAESSLSRTKPYVRTPRKLDKWVTRITDSTRCACLL